MSPENPFGPKGWTPERLGSLEGKTYLITGANAGTGFQAARTLLNRQRLAARRLLRDGRYRQ